LWRPRSVTRVLWRRCHCTSGRSHPHPSLRLLLLNLPYLRDRQGAAAVLLNGGLLPLKFRRRRWRSSFGDNGASRQHFRWS
jgi:hypothetical protein